MKMFRVYVLVNKMNRRFIATAEDPEQELRGHNRGVFKWTAQFRPWQLEWFSNAMSRREADKLERKLVPFKTNAGALQSLLDEHDSWNADDSGK